MKTKLLNLKTLFITMLCVASALGASAYDFYSNGFYYNIRENNTVEVTFQSTSGTDTYTGVITIPRQVTYNGTTYQVDRIGYNAFSLSRLIEVVIPDNITYISPNAFRLCDLLEKVSMTDAVTTIGYQAFSGCHKLRDINISNNIETIPIGCFSWCDSLKTITLPHSLKTIETEGFKATKNLKTIICKAWTRPTWADDDVFDAEVKANATLLVPPTYIAQYTSRLPWSYFSHIKALAYDIDKNSVYYVTNSNGTMDVTYKDTNYNSYRGNVYIPGSITLPEGTFDVEGIGTLAFFASREMTSVSLSSSNLKTIGDRSFMACSGLTAISIPSSVETIDDYAFTNCTSLRTITLREGLKTIGFQAMTNTAITKITLPASLESINGNSLSCCTNMTIINVQPGNPYYTSRNGVLYTSDGKTLMTYPAGKSSTSYTVLDGTEVIANNAFDRARSLTEILLPNSLREVQTSAFRECNALQQMDFPRGVTRIASSAMDNCNTMNHVTLPSTLNYIGSNAFNRCTSLSVIYVKATTPPYCDTYEWYDYDWDEDVIDYAFTPTQFNNTSVFVPEASVNSYKNADTWKKFKKVYGMNYLPEYITGDVDGNGVVGISDVTALIDYLLTGSSIDTEAADVNGDSSISIGDVTALIDILLNED